MKKPAEAGSHLVVSGSGYIRHNRSHRVIFARRASFAALACLRCSEAGISVCLQCLQIVASIWTNSLHDGQLTWVRGFGPGALRPPTAAYIRCSGMVTISAAKKKITAMMWRMMKRKCPTAMSYCVPLECFALPLAFALPFGPLGRRLAAAQFCTRGSRSLIAAPSISLGSRLASSSV